MRKTMLFAFNGDPMCFVHVLLNAIDMKKRGYDVGIVIEGAATKLIPRFSNKSDFISETFDQARSEGLITGVCRACSNKMGTLKDVEKQELPLLADMSGHPSIAGFMEEGYTIVTL